MHAVDPVYCQRLSQLHQELGIPVDYGTQRGLAIQPEADVASLVTVAIKPDGSPVRLIPPAASAWINLKSAAHAAGLALQAISGFRSVARQAQIITTQLAAGRPLVDLLASVAAPGYSEHHTGCAVDLGTPGCADLDEVFAQTPAYAWLTQHAGSCGFHLSYPRENRRGIVFEPWHWCWRA